MWFWWLRRNKGNTDEDDRAQARATQSLDEAEEMTCEARVLGRSLRRHREMNNLARLFEEAMTPRRKPEQRREGR